MGAKQGSGYRGRGPSGLERFASRNEARTLTRMECPSCGTENRVEAKYCGSCGITLARTCAACGTANDPGMRFCIECGTLIEEGSSAPPASSIEPSPTPSAERRLVSVLFVDLVGFTAASETRDPEDTRDLLSRYFETARTIIERYGGTIEKFIGDAVMAVWGAPIAQEDDAERAVRAALDLVQAVPQLDPALTARAGVLTGEAAVTIGAEGQGMVAGDLINTASRIQSEAEPGTVLVGDSTRRASEAAVSYGEAGFHELKGKAEPVALYPAVRVVAARAGEGRSAGLEAPFVGRDRELRLLKDLFHATAADRRAHLLAVVGIAGIGKSRLAWEFEKYADGLVEAFYWHRGRCLAYGDGVAYWALAEMIRSRAGIAESDDESSALRKLREAIGEHVHDPSEREWIEPRLQQLLGLVERTTSDRDDLFSAWRRFFECLAETGTVALVFEDLHWADSGLVAFVEHLLDWSRDLPIFVLALARPELADRHPGFLSSARSATTVTLDPLSDEAMDDLLRGLVPGLPDDAHATIRSRADGIPLYAVETVRMLLDRGLLAAAGNQYRLTGSLDSLEVPETLHALIAARLDGLAPEERRLLERAAVLGKTFSARGLSALAGVDDSAVEPVLASLSRKELLAIDTDPRSPERGNYGFVQALVQRIAYETLARPERRSLHLAAATFLAESGGFDPDEIAEVIATHYRDAYEAAPNAEDADNVRRLALEWLRRAGERAAALAATEDARRAFETATELARDDLERAALLERSGELAFAGDELDLAVQRLEQSRSLYLESGRTHDAARTAAPLSNALWNLARMEDALAVAVPALDVLSSDEPDEDVAQLAAEVARLFYFSGQTEPALVRVEQALLIAEEQQLPEVLSQALNTKSLIIMGKHPREARALVYEALNVALEHDLVAAALRAYNNVASIEWLTDRPAEARRAANGGFDFARQRGHRHYGLTFAAWEVTFLLMEGNWDDAFSLVDEFFPEQPTATEIVAQVIVFVAAALLDRGDPEEARRRLGLVSREVLDSSDLQVRSTALAHDALSAIVGGRPQHVFRACRDWIENQFLQDDPQRADDALLFASRVAREQGTVEELSELAARFDDLPELKRTRHLGAALGDAQGIVALAARDENAAIDAFSVALAAARSANDRWLIAQVISDYGLALVSFGRADEAEPLLAEAQALWEQMGAKRWLELLEGARVPTPAGTG
jgi:class 3 adenylate cyclase/tetratricopeptide (TPR) repeat protein